MNFCACKVVFLCIVSLCVYCITVEIQPSLSLSLSLSLSQLDFEKRSSSQLMVLTKVKRLKLSSLENILHVTFPFFYWWNFHFFMISRGHRSSWGHLSISLMSVCWDICISHQPVGIENIYARIYLSTMFLCQNSNSNPYFSITFY